MLLAKSFLSNRAHSKLSNGGTLLFRSPGRRRRLGGGASKRLGDIRTNSTTAAGIVKEGDVAPEFYVPKAQRKDKSAFVLDGQVAPDSIGLKRDMARLARNDRACPTRELNFTPEIWGIHKSPWRKWRHMMNLFKSSPFQRLVYPDLVGVAAVSIGLTYYNEVVASGAADAMLTMSAAGFGGATTAIGLLAGFRLNASYGRYEECRIFWGESVTHCRSHVDRVRISRDACPTHTSPSRPHRVVHQHQQHYPRHGSPNHDVDGR
jgi:hypothetical protein